MGSENQTQATAGSVTAVNSYGLPIGRATLQISRASPQLIPTEPLFYQKNQRKLGKVDNNLEKSSSQYQPVEDNQNRPNLSAAPISVIAVPKVLVEKHKTQASQMEKIGTDKAAHLGRAVPSPPQRSAASELTPSAAREQSSLPQRDGQLPKEELNRSYRRDQNDQERRSGTYEGKTTPPLAPMLQEFGPLKTCNFPIDPEYHGLEAYQRTGAKSSASRKKAKSVMPCEQEVVVPTARNNKEDERIVHTQLFPKSFPISATPQIEKQSIASRLLSQKIGSPRDVSAQQRRYTKQSRRQDEQNGSPKQQPMNATPKFKQNSRKWAQSNLQTSIERSQNEEEQVVNNNENNHPSMQNRPFPKSQAPLDRKFPGNLGANINRMNLLQQYTPLQTVRIKEYWLPLGWMPQDQEYIEVVNQFLSQLTSDQQAELDAWGNKKLDDLEPTAKSRIPGGERKQNLRPPQTAPKAQASNPFEPQGQSVQASELESIATPELPREGIDSGLSMQGRMQSRLRPPQTAEYYSRDRQKAAGRTVQGRNPMLSGQGQHPRRGEASLGNLSLHNAEATGASSLHQAETKEAGSSHERTAGRQGQDRPQRSQADNESKNMGVSNDIKTIITTKLNANKEQTITQDHKAKQKDTQRTEKESNSTRQPTSNPMITEKRRDQRLLHQIQKQQQSVDPQLNTQQAPHTFDQILQRLHHNGHHRGVVVSAGSYASTGSHDHHKIACANPRITKTRATDRQAQQQLILNRPVSTTFALSALDEILSNSLKSNLQNPFANEAIMNMRGRIQQNIMNPARGQTPNPRTMLNQRLPSLGMRPSCRSPRQGEYADRPNLTASTRHRGTGVSHTRGFMKTQAPKVETQATIPDTCSVKFQHPKPSLNQESVFVITGSQQRHRRVSEFDALPIPKLNRTGPQAINQEPYLDRNRATNIQRIEQIHKITAQEMNEKDVGHSRQKMQNQSPKQGDGALGSASGAHGNINESSRVNYQVRPSRRVSLGMKPFTKELKIDKNVLGSNKYYQEAEAQQPDPGPPYSQKIDEQPAHGQSIHLQLDQQPAPGQVSNKSLLLSYQHGSPGPHVAKKDNEGESATVVKRASAGSQMGSFSSCKIDQELSPERPRLHGSTQQVTSVDQQPLPLVPVEQPMQPGNPHEKSAMAIQTDFEEEYPAFDQAEAGKIQGSPEGPGNAAHEPPQLDDQESSCSHPKDSQLNRKVANHHTEEVHGAEQPTDNAISTNTFAQAPNSVVDQTNVIVVPTSKMDQQPEDPAKAPSKLQADLPKSQKKQSQPHMEDAGEEYLRTESPFKDSEMLPPRLDGVRAFDDDNHHGAGSDYVAHQDKQAPSEKWTRYNVPPQIPKLELSKLLDGTSGRDLQRRLLKTSWISGRVSTTRARRKLSVQERQASSTVHHQRHADQETDWPAPTFLQQAGLPEGCSIQEFQRKALIAIKENAVGDNVPGHRWQVQNTCTKIPPEAETKMKRHKTFWHKMHHNRGTKSRPRPTSNLKVGHQERQKNMSRTIDTNTASCDEPYSGLQQPEPSLIQVMQNIDNPRFVRMHQELFGLITQPTSQRPATNIDWQNDSRIRTIMSSHRGARPLASPVLTSRVKDGSARSKELSPRGCIEARSKHIKGHQQKVRVLSDNLSLKDGLDAIQIQGKRIDERKQARPGADHARNEAIEDEVNSTSFQFGKYSKYSERREDVGSARGPTYRSSTTNQKRVRQSRPGEGTHRPSVAPGARPDLEPRPSANAANDKPKAQQSEHGIPAHPNDDKEKASPRAASSPGHRGPKSLLAPESTADGPAAARADVAPEANEVDEDGQDTRQSGEQGTPDDASKKLAGGGLGQDHEPGDDGHPPEPSAQKEEPLLVD